MAKVKKVVRCKKRADNKTNDVCNTPKECLHALFTPLSLIVLAPAGLIHKRGSATKLVGVAVELSLQLRTRDSAFVRRCESPLPTIWMFHQPLSTRQEEPYRTAGHVPYQTVRCPPALY